ncbi:MAG: methyltransferase domain-containing protein [Planctomycetota bacterium]|nr:methyltransferase domain-containing protein [Planctomycetota bacterium]
MSPAVAPPSLFRRFWNLVGFAITVLIFAGCGGQTSPPPSDTALGATVGSVNGGSVGGTLAKSLEEATSNKRVPAEVTDAVGTISDSGDENSIATSADAELGSDSTGESVAVAGPTAPPQAKTTKDDPTSGGRYEFRAEHDPNGIGKFYKGREIAYVMGFAGAPWLERPEREREEATSKMIESLELKPGMTIADIGAGWVISLQMAEKVLPGGRVIAVDVQQEMLDLLQNKLKQKKVDNVDLLLGTEKSPRLDANSVDLAIMVDVYHELEYPFEMMRELSKAMKVGGRIAFVEFRLEDPNVPIKLVHKMSQAQVKREVSDPELFLRYKKTIDVLPWQHVVVFEKVGHDGGFSTVPDTQVETVKLPTPEEAIQLTRLPEGFTAQLFAHEPEIRQPIAITTDERGRLWVAENYSYAESAVNFAANQYDRIVILEDTDGDGKHDKRTVFHDRIKKLTSVEVGYGGVWALAAPNLFFIPDLDGDDIPDSDPIVALDGFDDAAVRHNIVNGLRWGPDGWLYGRHGILATSEVGRPGTSDSQRTRLNCSVWKFHPIRQEFEVVAHGTTNSWGHDFDHHGELFFINTVIGHLWHVIPGAHFRRMYGSDLTPRTYQLIEQTADHFHWDTRETWSDIRKGVTDTTSAAGGGHAHSGLMFYQGDNWPAEYRNNMFAINLHGRRLNRDLMEREQAGYVAHHANDFVFFDDPWFRGLDLITGPDGGVFVADWSDIGECHDNDGIHRGSGRIYKITYGDPKPVKGLNLAKLTSDQLAELQLHPNAWYSRQAQRVLAERTFRGQDLEHAPVRLAAVLADHSQDVTNRLRALWTLHAMHKLYVEDLIERAIPRSKR